MIIDSRFKIKIKFKINLRLNYQFSRKGRLYLLI